MQELSSSGTVNFARFYARRARRLLPAAITMVMVACGAEAIIMNPVAQFKTLKAALATILYSSNLYFAYLRLQYFFHQHAETNPLLHTWSPAAEEQFYMMWPLLLLLLVRLFKSVRGQSTALAAISLGSFLLCVWLTATNSVLAFFETPARVWEFGTGGLLVFMPERWLTGRRRLLSWLGGIGIIALIASAEFIPASMFPGYVAAILVVGTLLILMAGVSAPESLAPRLLCAKPLEVIGRLSYSLYLWHWPVLVIGQQLMPNNSVPMRLGLILGTSIMAVVSYGAIESPIRRQPVVIAHSGLTIWLAILGAILCVCAIGSWRAILRHSEQFRKYETVVEDIPEVYKKGCDPVIADPHPAIVLFRRDLSTKIDDGAIWGFARGAVVSGCAKHKGRNNSADGVGL
jgi:peptidoglycan/LPS O-acetylase OafA/YrhL